MSIYRGAGGATDTTDQATIDEVTTLAANAASSASSAASSASSASTSASTATTKATTATNAATTASTAASTASSAASTATAAATSASSSATSAAASATSADNDATTASAAAATASAAASDAASDAALAATANTNAQGWASDALTYKNAAATSATTASTAASAAATARDQTLAAFDSFDDRYLGTKSSDPTLDNDGNALVAGALYFNDTDGVMKVYDGSNWRAAYADVSGSLLAVNNLSDISNAASARTNLGLGTAATTASTDYATAAQGALADSALQSYTETDPVFTAWDKSTGISITESQISDLGSYLTSYTETDPVYTASSWYTTTNNSTNWDSAYGWGNHASAGYELTSNLGTAAYTASTAYATAAQGALADSALQSIPDNYVLNTGDAITGDLTFGDNNKAIFGAGSDLQIYHDGTQSIVADTGTGNLKIRAANFELQDASGTNTIIAGIDSDGEARLYYSGAMKLNTSSTGIDVTGTITTDRAYSAVTTDNDLSFDMSASNMFKCTPTGTGTLTFTNITAGQSGNIWLDNSGGYAISAASTTYISATDLTKLSTAGVYFVSYYADGTNVLVSVSPAVTSAGA